VIIKYFPRSLSSAKKLVYTVNDAATSSNIVEEPDIVHVIGNIIQVRHDLLL
jgi:hypothetical protein